MEEPIVIKRQAMVPVGCVKSNSTLPGSNATNGTVYGNGQQGSYAGGSSQVGYGSDSGSAHSAGYGDNSGSPRSAGYGEYSGSTRSAAYGSDQNNYYGSTRPTQSAGYNAYGFIPGSKQLTTLSSVPTTAPSVPCITITITEITSETITKCSNTYDCQLDTVVTKTNVRTTVVTLTSSVPVVVGIPVTPASTVPGRGYNMSPHPIHADGSEPTGTSASGSSNPGSGSPTKPSSNNTVNEAVKASPTVVVSQGLNGGPSRPALMGVGSNGTASSSTSTGYYYPAQFTGNTASRHRMCILIPAVISLVLFQLIL